jgi:hypothetical protein
VQITITSQAIETFLLGGRCVRSSALRFISLSFSLALLTNVTTLACGDEFAMNPSSNLGTFFLKALTLSPTRSVSLEHHRPTQRGSVAQVVL